MNTAVDKANGVGDHPLSVAAIAIVVGGHGLGCSRGEDYQLLGLRFSHETHRQGLDEELGCQTMFFAVARCDGSENIGLLSQNVDDVVSRKLGEIG